VMVGRTRQPFFRYQHALFRAMLAIAAGRLSEADRLAERAYELGKPLCALTAEHYLTIQRATIWRTQHRLNRAIPLIRETCGRFPQIVGWQAVFATMQAYAGNLSFARSELERIMHTDLAESVRDPFVLTALSALSELAYVARAPDQARKLYDAMLPHAALHV